MSVVKQLGPVVLLEADLRVDEGIERRTDIASNGLLESDAVRVDALANEAADLSISGTYRPPWIPEDRVQMAAAEFDDLLGSDRGALPLFDAEGDEWPKAGWYHIASGDIEPVHPGEPIVQSYNVALTEAGNRGSHYRAVQTAPTTVDHPFGDDFGEVDDDVATIILPASARKTRWLDPDAETTDPATPFLTKSTAVGNVDVYALGVLSIDRPTLLYDTSYQDDALACHAFLQDGDEDKLDADGDRQWEAMFATGHDIPAGKTVVLTNKTLRLYLTEEPGGEFEAEEFEETGWEPISIPSGEWVPVDVDLTVLDQHRLEAQVLLGAGDGDDAETFAVDVTMAFGESRAMVRAATGEDDPMPSGIEELFAPVARGSEQLVQPERALVPKREVRR